MGFDSRWRTSRAGEGVTSDGADGAHYRATTPGASGLKPEALALAMERAADLATLEMLAAKDQTLDVLAAQLAECGAFKLYSLAEVVEQLVSSLDPEETQGEIAAAEQALLDKGRRIATELRARADKASRERL